MLGQGISVEPKKTKTMRIVVSFPLNGNAINLKSHLFRFRGVEWPPRERKPHPPASPVLRRIWALDGLGNVWGSFAGGATD